MLRRFFIAIGLLLSAQAAFAQAPDTATLTGTITDGTSAAVAGAAVHLGMR